jgi:hypothetical protein
VCVDDFVCLIDHYTQALLTPDQLIAYNFLAVVTLDGDLLSGHVNIQNAPLMPAPEGACDLFRICSEG